MLIMILKLIHKSNLNSFLFLHENSLTCFVESELKYRTQIPFRYSVCVITFLQDPHVDINHYFNEF